MVRRLLFAMLLVLSLSPLTSAVWAVPGAQVTASVMIKDSLFEPATITVPVGTTITWLHAGALPHTVTADDKSWDSASLSAGGTFTHTFSAEGTFGYYCAFHGTPGSGMSAKVVVVAAAAGYPTAASAKDNVFDPLTITVPAGTTVTWTNTGAAPHTITADDKSYDSGLMNNGQTFSHIYSTPGTYSYYCAFHGGPGGAGMSGKVIVT